MEKLKGLKHLSLSDNELETVPDALSKLKKLELLNLANNKLTKLPANIDQWVSLKTLLLNGNNLSIQEQERIKNALPNTDIRF